MVLSIDVPYGWLSTSAEGKVLVTRPSGRAAPPQRATTLSEIAEVTGSRIASAGKVGPSSGQLSQPRLGSGGGFGTSGNDRHTSQSTEILDAGFRAPEEKQNLRNSRSDWQEGSLTGHEGLFAGSVLDTDRSSCHSPSEREFLPRA